MKPSLDDILCTLPAEGVAMVGIILKVGDDTNDIQQNPMSIPRIQPALAALTTTRPRYLARQNTNPSRPLNRVPTKETGSERGRSPSLIYNTPLSAEMKDKVLEILLISPLIGEILQSAPMLKEMDLKSGSSWRMYCSKQATNWSTGTEHYFYAKAMEGYRALKDAHINKTRKNWTAIENPIQSLFNHTQRSVIRRRRDIIQKIRGKKWRIDLPSQMVRTFHGKTVSKALFHDKAAPQHDNTSGTSGPNQAEA
ncbi:MAG: hypothetical protein J3Q66DRAFT_43787 [Benniella sp.]|nr:MAG: hypothetical protein J3Q66DRAFT_43787 [Benniella sp.]